MANIILNLTQHMASPEQVSAGVVDLSSEHRAELSKLLTINAIGVFPPSGDCVIRGDPFLLSEFGMCPVDPLPAFSRARRIWYHAYEIAHFALERAIEIGANTVMIGGAPFLMAPLERALQKVKLTPLYAFSERVSVDGPDGKKISVFKHLGFVPAC